MTMMMSPKDPMLVSNRIVDNEFSFSFLKAGYTLALVTSELYLMHLVHYRYFSLPLIVDQRECNKINNDIYSMMYDT